MATARRANQDIADAVPAPRVLREYALVADGERGALIGPDGSVAWLCAPRWDSPAVLSGLLGGGGCYRVTPADRWHVWGGYYESGTLIWRSRWVGDWRMECREALAMPADPHRVVLLRRIEALDGDVRAYVRLDLRAGYGHSPMTDLARHSDAEHADVWTGRSGPLWFRWTGAGRARHVDGGLAMRVELAAGGHHDLVLEISDRELAAGGTGAEAYWAATEQDWSQAVPACDDLIAVADARHAYAVLRGLTSASGATVAAATTSLPERLEAGRNYDYRYAWIRDQCYAGLAMAAHGPHPMLADSVRFITERLLVDGPGLMPAYTVAGEPIGGERALRLRGFPGGQPRSGNWVRKQFQLDAFGETLSLLAAAAGHGMLAEDDWRAVSVAADAIEKRWQEPDAGIWELDSQRWAHSRMACVSGLRAIAAAAAAGSPGGHGHREAAGWSSLADAITASLADCVHPGGRWQRAPDDERPDAALLLSVIRGGFDLADPRVKATIGAVRDELSADGFVYRFRHDDRPLHKAEGAFLLCGFWMALVEHAYGSPVAAAHWFERNRSAAGPPALYTEEYDVHQRQLRGNLPQAFVHAGMLECAVTLSRDIGLGGAAG
ncbi:glycoside hydrolase family 15 protein [Trebonia kvetii]|uniref:Glycoside hydrolase family 15 protein n=1 Tax=Trebonia kvetii TaxID=2480626 RepID=A0A6P2BNZ7_9ACTN|nr:glycoside hydrolase family 15 protein [Trebonia kvetii]TVZ00714.1 glycoside hydrolase family 15 protein [Trebonia kvetii]